jgi:aspartate-semialdehyde dehydrogenase
MKQYNVCVVGIGAVGTEMVRLLKKRNFPMKSLTILARSERVEVIDGEPVQVKVASPEAFDGMDFAFLCRDRRAPRVPRRPWVGKRSSAGAWSLITAMISAWTPRFRWSSRRSIRMR